MRSNSAGRSISSPDPGLALPEGLTGWEFLTHLALLRGLGEELTIRGNLAYWWRASSGGRWPVAAALPCPVPSAVYLGVDVIDPDQLRVQRAGLEFDFGDAPPATGKQGEAG
ncbi:hypothetical protein ACPZ19_42575 [Amycolatopsis lurida]